LIVMTALMNPTPQTVSTLHAFGFADRPEEYNETITQMMIHAPRERRKKFSTTYRDISPDTRVQQGMNLRLRLARMVYDRDAAPLRDIIDAASEDIVLFHKVSRELGNHLNLLTIPDQDRLMDLSLAALATIAGDANLARQTGPAQAHRDQPVFLDRVHCRRPVLADAGLCVARQGVFVLCWFPGARSGHAGLGRGSGF